MTENDYLLDGSLSPAALHARILQTVTKAYPAVIPYLSDETKAALKAADGYPGVRSDYWHAVYDGVYGYLTGNSQVGTFSRPLATAAASAFISAGEIGYQDAGGELPMDDDTAAWLRSEIDAELGHIDDLFARLKEEWEGLDPAAEANARAEGYARHLDGILNEAKLRGSKNITLTWVLGSTEKHCKTCASLDGKKHRISWFLDRDYIPHKPGAAMDCGGYNCDCRLVDNDGNEYSV